MKKLDFTQEKYDNYYSYKESSYGEILYNKTVTAEMCQALGEEADRLIPIAKACVDALGDSASDDLKKLLDYTEKYRSSVTGENYDTLSLNLPSDVESSTISDTIKNRGILLYDACKYADFVVQQCALIALKNSNYVKDIRNDKENYQYISAQFDALKTADDSYAAGQQAYNTLINKTLPAASQYSINDIVAIVCYDKLVGFVGYDNFMDGIIWSSNIDSKFKWLIKMYYFDKDNMFQYILQYAKAGFQSDSDLSDNISTVFSLYNINYLLDLTDELINTLCLISVDLKLNETPSTTSTDVFQTGNTYQIFETTDQKIYWGTSEDADKLVFEIPIDFPEQTTDGAKITNIKISDVYKNPDYLATENATTENATSGT